MPRVSFAPFSPCLNIHRLLARRLPSLPPTVQDVDVPLVFRGPFILSGYRPVGLSWRCYLLSLFQIHNETLIVWSHLLANVVFVSRFLLFTIIQGGGILGFRLQGPEGQGFSVDVSSLPLVLYVFSAVTYLSCSAAAHLLHPRSEQVHDSLFFLDRVTMAVYQYSCALALCLYSSDDTWLQSVLGQIFLPLTAFFTWFSSISCCYTKLQFQRRHTLYCQLCQVVPMGVTSLLVISPVFHRLNIGSWTSNSAPSLHVLQVVLFLLAAVFFSCPIPEHLSPGRYDIIGHGHQLFHILQSFCTLVQQEALFRDFLLRRPALVRTFGEEGLLLACVSFPCHTLCCGMTALSLMWRAEAHKEQRQ